MADSSPEPAVDVRLLAQQELPRGDFPGGKGEVFRVYFAPEVHGVLWQHGTQDTTVEICGVLVGTWERDCNGPFVRITESIRGEAAENKFAEVTFTHATWAKINARMDTDFAHLSIVGWYHTHPDFGIFLSDRDRFIHEHFFSAAGQVALVIDPVRKIEGVFVWREGKPALSDHYWVGDRIMHETAAGEPKPAAAAPSTPPPPPSSLLTRTTQLLAFLALFLLGYLVAGFRSNWEEQMLKVGAVYHFGIWKGLRPGLREELDVIARDLKLIAQAVPAHASKPSDGKSTEKDAPIVTTAQLVDGLDSVRRHVESIRSLYGFTDTEQEAVRQFLERVERLAGQRVETPNASADKEKPGESPASPSADKASASK